MATPSPNSYVFTPGVTLYAGMATPSGGTTLTTITLANTSSTTQASDFVSPMFGLPLKQGDVPAGQYPAFFLADDTPVPATIHSVTSWPDGSMKWCGVFLRVPTTVAGSGSLAITVKNGGSAPGSSARALSDFTAANLSVELTGVTNLTGTWTATLADAIANGTAVQIADGPAGAIWRVLGDFKQVGTAHGQLVCWHYVSALQNSSGGLHGIRYLGRVAQPWFDVSSPPATRRVMTARVVSGSTTVRSLQGYDTTETLGSNIGMCHYTSFYTAGTDAKWDFFQSGGSASADCTVRVVHDKTYFSKSQIIPPYDLSVSPTSSDSVDYYPYGKGSYATRDLDTTGPSNFIGVLPKWCVTHFMTQAAVDERAVRVSALVSGGFRVAGRMQSTKQIVPATDIQPSYAGLSTPQPTWRFGGGFYTGIQQPTVNTSLWSGDNNPSHRPNPHYYPYLITGEPQYLDMAVEQAGCNILADDPGTYIRNVGSSITSLRVGDYAGLRNVQIGSGGTVYKGAGIAYEPGGVRIAAWATRDVAQTMAVLPETPPDGADVKGYFKDVLTSTYASINDLNSKMPASWRDAGLFSTNITNATLRTDDALYESPWMTMYLSISMCHQSLITGIPEAVTVRQHLSKFISSVNSAMDVALLSAYRWRQWKGDGTLVESIGEVLFSTSGTLTFDAGANTATISGTQGQWSPTNGDKFAFTTNLNSYIPFAGAANGATVYAVNSSGKSFKLSATAGGSAATIASSGTCTSFFAQLQNAAPQLNFESGQYYVSLSYEAARFHEACGDSNVAPARAKIDANVASLGLSFTSDPRSAMAAAF